MYGIDTYSWYKLIYLKNNGFNELIIELLKVLKIFITHDVKKEYDHFFPEDKNLLYNIDILGVTEEKKVKFLTSGFDEADASLLAFVDDLKYMEKKKDNVIIITEDHLMLNEGVTKKQNIIQVVDFFRLLERANFVTHREFYKIVGILREMKNITREKEKKMLRNNRQKK